MGGAVAQVLETVELLENVLLHLDANKVFVLQRVSIGWRNTINQSIRIKRVLFLASVGGHTVQPIAKAIGPDIGDAIPVYAPGTLTLNVQHIHHCFSPATRNMISDPELSGDIEGRLDGMCQVTVGRKGKARAVQFARAGPSNRSAGASLERLWQDFHNNASWKRMFLTQPPCTAIQVHTLVRPVSCPRRELQALVVQRCRIVHKDGITIGDLFNELEKEILGTWPAHGDRKRSKRISGVSLTWSMLEMRPTAEQQLPVDEHEDSGPRGYVGYDNYRIVPFGDPISDD